MRFVALLLVVGVAASLAGCAQSAPVRTAVAEAPAPARDVYVPVALDQHFQRNVIDREVAAPAPDNGEAAPEPAPAAPMCCKTWSGCGLPCQQGIGHDFLVRAVGGYAFYGGTDAPDPCWYFGADIGKTWCACGPCGGCWGFDLFWRTHGCQFEVDPDEKDGGTFHHFGIKATYQASLGSGRWYWWAGLGPEFFIARDYVEEDEGFGVYGEIGIAYILNETWRVRAGINAHAVNVESGRQSAGDVGDARWLFIVAPVLQIEAGF